MAFSLSNCASVSKFFGLGANDTHAEEAQVLSDAKASDTATRSPASMSHNPLRIMEYCAVDNFSRVLDCYPSLELCERAAQGFALCSGR